MIKTRSQSKQKQFNVWITPSKNTNEHRSSFPLLQDLKKNYKNPKSGVFFAGIKKIFHFYNGLLPVSTIKKFLITQPESISFARNTKKYYNPTYVRFKGYQFQCDLIDVSR